MTDPQIRTDLTDRILTITLDRPAAMNAFTAQMLREMIAAFDRADMDDEVRAVIVTAAATAPFAPGPICRAARRHSTIAIGRAGPMPDHPSAPTDRSITTIPACATAAGC